MPQLDFMTFYIQGFSVLTSLIFTFYYFYFYFLPSISISLFCRFFIKKHLKLENEFLKIEIHKLISRLLKFEIFAISFVIRSLKSLNFFLEAIFNTKYRKLVLDFVNNFKLNKMISAECKLKDIATIRGVFISIILTLKINNFK